MPITVGDVNVFYAHSRGFAIWVEYRVEATDGDPDDPQWTEITPLRYAFIVSALYDVAIPGLGGVLDRAEASTDPQALIWNTVPNRFKKRITSEVLGTFQSVKR